MSDEQPASVPTKPEKAINKRLQRTQAQVNEVVDIMRVNIEKVLERDKNLSQLDDRADALQAGASQFEASAGKLKRKFWWRNCKLLIILIGLIGVIGIVIIVGLTSGKRDTGNFNGSYHLKENSSQNPFLYAGSQPSELMPSGQEGLPPWSTISKSQRHFPATAFRHNKTDKLIQFKRPDSSSSSLADSENDVQQTNDQFSFQEPEQI